MPVPVGTPSDLAAYLQELEDRIAALETPQGPVPVPAYATADMPTASENTNRVIRNSTLDILAVSNGTDWIRQDTGAAI